MQHDDFEQHDVAVVVVRFADGFNECNDCSVDGCRDCHPDVDTWSDRCCAERVTQRHHIGSEASIGSVEYFYSTFDNAPFKLHDRSGAGVGCVLQLLVAQPTAAVADHLEQRAACKSYVGCVACGVVRCAAQGVLVDDQYVVAVNGIENVDEERILYIGECIPIKHRLGQCVLVHHSTVVGVDIKLDIRVTFPYRFRLAYCIAVGFWHSLLLFRFYSLEICVTTSDTY